MVQVIDQQGNIPLTAVFFISLMILGNYMLLNLFLAILLKFISENSEHEKLHENGEDHEHSCGEDEAAAKEGKKDEKKDGHGHGDGKDGEGREMDGENMNSSNSNIEEEFEQIKIQL